MLEWFVLYTKPQNEKKVAERLEKAGFEVYCPVVKTVKQWSDRKKKIQVPLFKSYVFICIEEADRDKVFAFPGVVRYLFWLGKPAIVKPQEIAAIQDFLRSYGENRTLTVTNLEPGQRVKVIAGALANLSGEIVRIHKNKVILQIDSLGMAIQAELHHSQVA